MILTTARELLRIKIINFGVPIDNQSFAISNDIIDAEINAAMREHFTNTLSLQGDWQTLAIKNLSQYLLDDSVLSISNVQVAAEQYYPMSYPWVEGVKQDSTGRTRIIAETGQTVEDSGQRFFWVRDRTLYIHPYPAENTTEKTSGTCTISSSVITITSGDLGEDNSLIDHLILIGSNLYMILSNDSDTIIVDGEPASSETTFTVYNKGILITGIRLPSELTVGSSELLPGNESDAQAIIQKAFIRIIAPLAHRIDNGGYGLINNERAAKEVVKSARDQGTFTFRPNIPVQGRNFRSGSGGV